jgi:AraC-like DNA-binding protein
MEHQFFYESHVSRIRITKAPSYSFTAHMHDKVELLYAITGTTIVNIDDTSHTLTPGEAVLIWPNRIHSYTNIAQGVDYMAIIDPSCIHEHANLFITHDCAYPYLPAEKVHPHVSMCLEALMNKPTPPMQLVNAYLDIVMGRLLERLDLVPANDVHRQELVGNILLYIAEHIHDEITLDTLARDLFANKYQISRIFSTKIGCNLCTYVNRLRIASSLNLLKDPTLNISDIAEQCGFNSERTFFRVFREQCGITPKQYRQRLDMSTGNGFINSSMPRTGAVYADMIRNQERDPEYSFLFL